VSKGDQLVERGATRLQELADRAAARGDGIGEWLSEELRNDAAFLRKLKPSLVKARAQANSQGSTEPEPPAPPPPPLPAAEAPPAAAPPVEAPAAETQPMAARPKPKAKPRPKAKAKPKGKRGGPPPVVIVGAALVAGILIAKFVDWRGHAHPKD
jgi:outer membrane biosynthesis protein TonB